MYGRINTRGGTVVRLNNGERCNTAVLCDDELVDDVLI